MAARPLLQFPGCTVPVRPVNARHETHLRGRGYQDVADSPHPVEPAPEHPVDAPVDLTRPPQATTED